MTSEYILKTLSKYFDIRDVTEGDYIVKFDILTLHFSKNSFQSPYHWISTLGKEGVILARHQDIEECARTTIEVIKEKTNEWEKEANKQLGHTQKNRKDNTFQDIEDIEEFLENNRIILDETGADIDSEGVDRAIEILEDNKGGGVRDLALPENAETYKRVIDDIIDFYDRELSAHKAKIRGKHLTYKAQKYRDALSACRTLENLLEDMEE